MLLHGGDHSGTGRDQAQKRGLTTVNHGFAVHGHFERAIRGADHFHFCLQFPAQSRRHTGGVDAGHDLDPLLLGRPTGFRVPIRDVRLSAGAGFVTAYLGEMRTMPGLPSKPGGENIDIDENGETIGLF